MIKKHTHQDHKMPKQTAQESFLHETIKKMRAEFEIRMLNIVAQVRSVAIAAKVDPKDFIDAFRSEEKQTVFFNEQSEYESKKIAEEKKKQEEAAAKEKSNIPPELKEFGMNQEMVADLIEGPGDKIV